MISAIACFLGRLCNRRSHSSKPPKQTHNNNNNSVRPKQGGGEFGTHNGFRPNPKEAAGSHQPGNTPGSFRSNSKEGGGGGDVELGFDMRIPNGKPNGFRSDSRGRSYPHGNGDHMKGEVKHGGGDHGEP